MKDKLAKIFCAVFRHSRIVSSCFGYQDCARCRARLGDTLAGVYNVYASLNCGCAQCQTNYKKTGFIDKFLTPKPEWQGKTPEQWEAEIEESRRAIRNLANN